ncbi:hypothetical protein FJY63_07120, partial [Candidatus Sumerlaeota bacterium]|nr:hypothetical protein [Candidatus Sumerlaeota bacterium]
MRLSRRSGKQCEATIHATAVVWALAVATTLWFCAPATAETIVRKDGRQIEGQVVSEDDVYVTIQTTIGTFRVKKSDIVSITGRRAVSQSERDGRDLLASGELDKALVKFQEALADAKKPDERKEIDALIADIQARIREREESRFLAELRAAEQLVADKRFNDAMAQLEALLGRSEKEWVEKRGVGTNPAARVIRRHMLDVRLKEADFYVDQINYAEAADAYRKATELMPDEPEPYLRMGRLLQRRGGKDADIIQCYTSGIALALRTHKPSEMIDDYYELGKAYIRAAGPSPTQKEPNQDYLMKGIDRLLQVARDAPASYPFLASQMQEGFDRLSKVSYDADTLAKMLESTLAANPQVRRVRWILAEVYR